VPGPTCCYCQFPRVLQGAACRLFKVMDLCRSWGEGLTRLAGRFRVIRPCV
jgi:hypothetical protein